MFRAYKSFLCLRANVWDKCACNQVNLSQGRRELLGAQGQSCKLRPLAREVVGFTPLFRLVYSAFQCTFFSQNVEFLISRPLDTEAQG